MKVLVKMTKTVKGSIDGVNTQDFVEGEQYEITEELLKDFQSQNACEKQQELDDADTENPIATASIDEAPENKMIDTNKVLSRKEQAELKKQQEAEAQLRDEQKDSVAALKQDILPNDVNNDTTPNTDFDYKKKPVVNTKDTSKN